MNIGDIRLILERALPIRIPQYDPNEAPTVRIEKLQDHILKVAWHRAELEEALHWCIEARKVLQLKWDDVQGWQSIAGSKPTQDAINRAKRQIDRDTWLGLAETRALIDSLHRQISRLGGSDYDAASRVYTLLSGS